MLPASIVLLISLYSTTEAAIEHGVWDYESKGPLTWSNSYPQFCSGRKQSPIDFGVTTSIMDPILAEFNMRVDETAEYGITLQNDGHKVQVNLGSNLVIEMGLGSTMYYKATQLHWHWGSDASKGSEHTVAGLSYPMEGHLVFWNSFDYKNASTAFHRPNGLAVLGVFYELSLTDNPLIKMIEKYLPQINKPGSLVDIKLKANNTNFLDAFLPNSTRHFYRYEGSLTTPECTENVLWTVYTKTVPISNRQLSILRNLQYPSGKAMQNNFRPVQPLNSQGRPGANRVLYRTFDRQGRAFGDLGYTAGVAGSLSSSSALIQTAVTAFLSCLIRFGAY